MATLLNATMLYRPGITEKLHGVAVDWIVVDECDVDAMLDDGWFRSPEDIKKAQAAEKEAAATEATQKAAPKK
jgi:hypothetical protein